MSMFRHFALAFRPDLWTFILRSMIKMATASVSGVFRLVCPSSYADNVLAGFSALQEQKRMTDFTIKTNGGKSIHVHKMLLGVASDYFSAMFESSMKEVRENEVHLDTLSENAVCDVVDYLYGREISIKWEHMEDYLDVIEHFQLSNMKKQVEKCIFTEVDASSAIHWCKIATKYALQGLRVGAKAFIELDFYKAVNAYDPTLSDMLELLRDKDLTSVENDLKLKVVIAWVMCNENERKQALAELVECIKLEQCSTGYLAFVLETHHSLLTSQVSVIAEISQALASGLTKGKHLTIGSKFTVVGGVATGGYFFKNMYRIDLNAGTLEDAGTTPDVLHRWHAARCATPSGALFSVSGGTENTLSSTTNDCILFDPDTLLVSHLPPPPVPRMKAGAAAIGTKLYLLGGYKQYSKMSCLDLKTEKWSDCADLIHDICFPIVCTIGKYIFALTSSELSRSCYRAGDPIYLQCYDSDKDQWSLKASPPIRETAGASAVVVWNNFYLVGGKDRLCLSYSTCDDVWHTLDKPSKGHRYSSAVHINGRIILCGGSLSGVIEEYNLAANKWKMSSLALPHQLDFHICVKN